MVFRSTETIPELGHEIRPGFVRACDRPTEKLMGRAERTERVTAVAVGRAALPDRITKLAVFGLGGPYARRV